MKKWKITLYLAAIFAAGFLSGGVVAMKLAAHRFGFGRPGGNGPANHWAQELHKRLDLTPEQTQQITPIITGATDEFIQTVTGQMLSTAKATNARIAPLLTPAQQEKLLLLNQEQEKMIRRLTPPTSP
jgi:Spy/CpxP family protein refolding chaperone